MKSEDFKKRLATFGNSGNNSKQSTNKQTINNKVTKQENKPKTGNIIQKENPNTKNVKEEQKKNTKQYNGSNNLKPKIQENQVKNADNCKTIEKNNIIDNKKQNNGNIKAEQNKHLEKSDVTPLAKPKNEYKNAANGSENIINDNREGSLKNGKHPVIGAKLLEQIGKKRKIDIYLYPLEIKFSPMEPIISILFVGQSGSGKSTFINAFLNHLLGIKMEDNIRYKIILGDKSKEKDQTKSQTDKITIYNIRSIKYNNRIFKLIDTPGAGDTRNQNEGQISEFNKDIKEKEFLEMYNNLFDKEIGCLNSISFVIKFSENRENEFQKKVINNITNLFASDVGENSLANLTFADTFEEDEDENEGGYNAVQLLKKYSIFAKKGNNNEWYFPVSCTSFFKPFQIGNNHPAEPLFIQTNNSFNKFTEKVLTLDILNTHKTQKNLKLKNKQEQILKKLKQDILTNLIVQKEELKNIKNELENKIENLKKEKEVILNMETEIKSEEESKSTIEQNLRSSQNEKAKYEQKLQDNKKIEENLKSEMQTALNNLKLIQDEEKIIQNKLTLAKKKEEENKNEIDQINKKIKEAEERINKTKENKIEEQKKIDELKNNLKNAEKSLKKIEKDINDKQKKKDELDKSKLDAENKQSEINSQLESSKKEKELLEAQKNKKEQDIKNYENDLKLSESKMNLKITKVKELKKQKLKLIVDKTDQMINDLKERKKKVRTEQRLKNTEKDNLICLNCRKNCHKDCDCWGKLLKIRKLCKKISNGICSECGCSVDMHNRDKNIYYDEKIYLNKEEIREIDNKINNLELAKEKEELLIDEEYNKQIEEYRQAYDDKKDNINKNINSINADIDLLDANILNKNNNISKLNNELNKTSNKLDIKDNEINNESELKKKEDTENEITKKSNEAENLEKSLKEKEEEINNANEEIRKAQKLKEDILQKQDNLLNTQFEIDLIDLKKKTQENEKKKLEDQLNKVKNELDPNQINEIENKIQNNQAELDKKTNLIKVKKDNKTLKEVLIKEIEGEIEGLQEKEKENNKKLNDVKFTTIQQFLKMKVLIDEIENLTLNKATIKPVKDYINDLLLDEQFFEKKSYFKDIIDEFDKEINKIKKNSNKIDEMKKQEEDILSHYKLKRNEIIEM